MPSRLVHLLLVAVLLLGQVGGWLHELSHHAAVSGPLVTLDAPATGGGPADRKDAADRQCLLCLSYAALALSMPGVILALALLPLQFSLPAGAVVAPLTHRRRAHAARGPPAFS